MSYYEDRNAEWADKLIPLERKLIMILWSMHPIIVEYNDYPNDDTWELAKEIYFKMRKEDEPQTVS